MIYLDYNASTPIDPIASAGTVKVIFARLSVNAPTNGCNKEAVSWFVRVMRPMWL